MKDKNGADLAVGDEVVLRGKIIEVETLFRAGVATGKVLKVEIGPSLMPGHEEHVEVDEVQEIPEVTQAVDAATNTVIAAPTGKMIKRPTGRKVMQPTGKGNYVRTIIVDPAEVEKS